MLSNHKLHLSPHLYHLNSTSKDLIIMYFTFKCGYIHPSPAGTTSKCPRTATLSSRSPYSTQPARLSTFFVFNRMFSPNAKHILTPLSVLFHMVRLSSSDSLYTFNLNALLYCFYDFFL